MPARRSARATAPAVRQLSERDIVDTALRLTCRIGSDKLSMRKLAAELGVTPMAIYHHVPNKEALLYRMVDAVLATVPMPAPDRGRWQAQLKDVALISFQRLNAHPDLRRILNHAAQHQVRSSAGDRPLWDRAPGRRRLRCALGYAGDRHLQHVSVRRVRRGERAHAARQAQPQGSAGEPQRRPRIAAVGRCVRELRLEDSLDYGIDAVLAGIALQRSRAARSA